MKLDDECNNLDAECVKENNNKFIINSRILLLFIFIISCIPLVSMSNIIIGGLFLILTIIYYDGQLIKKGCKKSKIIFNNILVFILYYIVSAFQIFITYISVFAKIGEKVDLSILNLNFIFLDIKVLVMIIPITISSFLCFKRGIFNSMLYRILVLGNLVLFMLILK